MNLRYLTYETPFIYPFTISKGTKTHQPALIVELDYAGIKGYGEAPAIGYYDITVEKMVEDILQKKLFIEKYALTDPERYWHYLHHLLPRDNFLVCALDIAAWDIYGKLRQQPLYKLWGLDYSTAPLTDYTIGIGDIESMIKKLQEKPWPIYKVKLGTPSDIATIRALRDVTDARLRVDANAGWSREEAVLLVNQLKDYDIELIEQPLAKDDWEGMAMLKKHSTIPLIADESCVDEKDVEKCAQYFDGINVKLTKCGGITPARRMIAHAKQLGLSVMIGNMNETAIGTAAIAHLMPLADFADADGPLLLASSPASGLSYDNGRVILSENPGLGIFFTDQM